MNKVMTMEPTAEETVQIHTAIQAHLLEIEAVREQIHRDQSEIEASGVRTDATLKQIQAQLARLQAS